MDDSSKTLSPRSFLPLFLLPLLAAALIAVACGDATPAEREAKPAAVPVPETPADIFRAELNESLREPDPFLRAQRLGALLPTMGAGSVASVIDAITDDGMVDLRGTEYDLLVRAWARFHPEAAAQWALTRSDLIYRTAVLHAALFTWASMDPQAAAAATWGWSTAAKGLERVVPSALVRGWYRHGNSPELVEFVRTRPMGMLRQRALSVYIRVAAQTDGPAAIMQWAESLDDEDDDRFKLSAFRIVAAELTIADVEAGLRWCEKYCDTEYGKNMRSRIARTWATRDGPAALEWLSKGPAGNQRDFDIRLAYARWIRVNSKEALEWLPAQEGEGGLPDWLQSALPPYSRAVATSSPAKAVEWAEKIKDEKTREPIVVFAARIWLGVDKPAAEAWLEQASLSEEALEQIRSGPEVPNRPPADPGDDDDDA